ncbi:MAG: hypothetical protein ACPGJV_15875 [Bacteriovoracaceae bacterium]
MEAVENIQKHLDSALLEYSKEENLESLLEAKKIYFDATGIANEDDDDFESRMSIFNDWYLLQFQSSKLTRTIINDYFSKREEEQRIQKALSEVNYSIFEYTGKSFKKQIVLKDILHKDKITLMKDHSELALLKGEYFVGRVLSYEESSFLLSGVCVVPKEVIGIIKKEAKKVRKLEDTQEEHDFLLQIEYFTNKWKRYNHIAPERIFEFEIA